MDFSLEVVPVPVSEVDRAKRFYSEQVGFVVDLDTQLGDGMRLVQLTPPGSGCSIHLSSRILNVPPGVLEGLQLVVSDIEAARVPSSGGLIAGSMVAPLAVRRVRPAFVMAGGLVLAAVGFAVLTRVDGTSGLALIVIGSVVFALGVAVLGSIGTAVYRSEVADAVPGGVPHDAAEAARDTLGGAVAVADELRDRLGAGLLDAAREAFTQGLQLTAITSAALSLGVAILVMVLLRHVRTGSEPEDQTDTEPAGAVVGGAGIEKILGRPAEVQDDCAPGIEES